MTEVMIVDTGVANTASIRTMFSRLGASSRLTQSAEDVADAPVLVLPGVGAFAAGMELIERCTLTEPLRERITLGRPTLCVCLGLQVLFESSQESPGVAGLGVVSGEIVEFPDGVVRPQFGWNLVSREADGELGYAYFANSFYAAHASEDWSISWSEHGMRFIAAMQRDGVLACQFHPELSGRFGHGVVEAWWRSIGVETAC